MYEGRVTNLTKQLEDLKSANPNATGIKQLQDDISKAQVQQEKLNKFQDTLKN